MTRSQAMSLDPAVTSRQVGLVLGRRAVDAVRPGWFQRTLSGIRALEALVTGAEIWLEHDRASFGNQMMWLPVVLTPPVAVAALAGSSPTIGWGTPTAFGAAVAAPDRQVIPVEGDGSHQITATQLGSIGLQPVAPIMLIVANDVYAVEEYTMRNDDRARVRGYDKLPPWRYHDLPAAMGCSDWFTPVVRSNGELDAALKRARDENRPSYIEVRLQPELATAKSERDHDRQYQIAAPGR
jgi:indolepyruvate decarboxylase